MVTVVRKKEYMAFKVEFKRLKEALPYLTCSVKGILSATPAIVSNPTSSGAAAAQKTITSLCKNLQLEVDRLARDYQPAAPQHHVPALTEGAAANLRWRWDEAMWDIKDLHAALEGSEQCAAELVAELKKTRVSESRLMEQARKADLEKERKVREAQQESSRLQHLTAEQAAQIVMLEQQVAAAVKANSKAQRREVIVAEGATVQLQQLTQAQEHVGQLSLKMGAAEQLNKQLQQENAELQEALDRLRAAGCEAADPDTPVQRTSSSRSMLSCSG